MRFVTRVGVYGVVRSEQGVLMVLTPAGPWAGSWDLPGGAIDPGEGPREAAARHLSELFGLTVDGVVLDLDDAVADVAEWRMPDGVAERLHRVAIVYASGPAAGLEPTGDVRWAWSPLGTRTPLADRYVNVR